MRTHENMRFLERVSDALELPGEAMGLPLVTVTGDGRVLIENHRGILFCGEEKIAVRCRKTEVSVEGKRLELAVLTERELLIRGCIEAVRMEKEGGREK